MTFLLGEERFVAGPGTFVHMPIGSRHGFRNESEQPARMIITVVPAGLEQMFFEVGRPLPDDATAAPAPTAEDIRKLLEAAPRYGVEIFPPEPA